MRGRLDGLTVVAMVFFVFLLANVVRDRLPEWQDLSADTVNAVVETFQSDSKQGALLAASGPDSISDVSDEPALGGERPLIQPIETGSQGKSADFTGEVQTPGDANTFSDPYDNYVVTQGPHGMSYGHYAVDITAGKGASIKSPINGLITALYVDQYGNTTLVIENERWQVIMLHGNYSVAVGQVVAIGDPLGEEWNNGYTLDANGRICTGRDCGYHMHLNVFDKTLNSNIDPFTVLKQ